MLPVDRSSPGVGVSPFGREIVRLSKVTRLRQSHRLEGCRYRINEREHVERLNCDPIAQVRLRTRHEARKGLLPLLRVKLSCPKPRELEDELSKRACRFDVASDTEYENIRIGISSCSLSSLGQKQTASE